MRSWSFAMVACALALAGCGDDDGTPTDAGTGADTGTMLPGDAGGRDAGPGRADAGPGDPCATDDAISTVACNGEPVGAGVARNEFGGLCTPDAMNPQGSCTAATDVCAARTGVAEGICLRGCDPAATYVTTGTCPMGSRCFTLGMAGSEYGLCFPDCRMPTDCTSMGCDAEGSCETPATAGPTDAGVPTDAGPTDAGVPADDAGVPATDAGVPATDAG